MLTDMRSSHCGLAARRGGNTVFSPRPCVATFRKFITKRDKHAPKHTRPHRGAPQRALFRACRGALALAAAGLLGACGGGSSSSVALGSLVRAHPTARNAAGTAAVRRGDTAELRADGEAAQNLASAIAPSPPWRCQGDGGHAGARRRQGAEELRRALQAQRRDRAGRSRRAADQDDAAAAHRVEPQGDDVRRWRL